jgi:hypothetical protein
MESVGIESTVERKEGEPVAEAPSEDMVVPIAKDEYNFLKTFFLARNDALLKEPEMQIDGNFVEFGGDSFNDVRAYKKTLLARFNKNKSNDVIDGLVSNRTTLITDLNNDIRKLGDDFNQSLEKYQNNDLILYDFCTKTSEDKTTKERYVFLIRNKGDTTFRLPEGPDGAVFVPEMNDDQNIIIIVFLEVVVVDTNHYYDLVVAKNTTSQSGKYPYCARYVIKENSAGTLGCNLANMGKQRVVVQAIDIKIAINEQNEQLIAFRNVVGIGLSPRQQTVVDSAASLAEQVGAPTETNSTTDSGSLYTPSDNGNPRVNDLFANLPSFKQTLVPEENICGDKTLIELLKNSVVQKRPSLFSGGRRYKKTTQKRRGALPQQNKTKRRAQKNV